MERKYFAAKESVELVKHLMAVAESQHQFFKQSGLSDKVRQSFDAYYGNHFKFASGTSGSSIKAGGRQGEIKLVGVNQYRNLLRHMLNMITSQKPAFDAKAINSDPESMSQARLATQIIPALQTQYKIDEKLYKAAEAGLVTAEGYVAIEWSMERGRAISAVPVADEQGEVITDEDGQPRLKIAKDGDLKVKHVSRTDTYRDNEIEEWEDNQWVMWREKENRYDLMAQYPHLAEALMSAQPAETVFGERLSFQVTSGIESPYVWKYCFFHKASDSVPMGRKVYFIDDNIIFADTQNPYGNLLPIFRMCPSQIIGSQNGYTDGFDILPLQQVYDVIYSAIFTNGSTFGIQSVLVPETCNITPTQISQSMVFLKYNPAGGKPEALQLTSTPAELFKLLELTEHLMEIISGINSVARGAPDSSLKSGVALGLVQSMAIMYASGFQKQWVNMLTDVATFVMKLFQNFATTERFIAVAGKDSASYIKAFKGDDIKNVDRMTIDLGNPMSQTIAGKADLADKLLSAQMLPTPQEYITVATTGQLSPAIKPVESMLSLIHQENDDLMKGLIPKVEPTDNDEIHIRTHLILLNDPEIRNNQQRAGAVYQHLAMHDQSWQQKRPVDGMIAGQQPYPFPAQPQAPQGQPDMGAPALGQDLNAVQPNQTPLPKEAQLYAPNTTPTA